MVPGRVTCRYITFCKEIAPSYSRNTVYPLNRGFWITVITRSYLSRDHIRLRSHREHGKLLAEAKEVPDEGQDSKISDAALRHLVESHANREDMKRELTSDQAEALSTSELSLTKYPQIRR